MNRKTIRVIGAVIVVGALAGILLLTASPKDDYGDLRERAEKAVEAMNKEQREDVYGGATPEETLELFTDALKKGDTELASKYFLPEDREEQFLKLKEIEKKGGLELFTRFVLSRKLQSSDASIARYIIVTQEGFGSPLVLVKSINEKWKIRTL